VATLAVALALLVSVASAQFVAAAIADELPDRSPLGEALVEAAERGDMTTVRALLDSGMDVDTRHVGDGTGLSATYFDNMNFTGPSVSRIDPTVDFDLGIGSPDPAIQPEEFSAVWTGQVQAIESGKYRFQTSSDDGVRLWVNGQQIISNWTDHAPTTNTSSAVSLVAGQKYAITLEYYERTGGATAEHRAADVEVALSAMRVDPAHVDCMCRFPERAAEKIEVFTGPQIRSLSTF
jgi:hypothetical protein